MNKALDKNEQGFVVKMIEKGNTIDEIINAFNKKNKRVIGERTVRRISYKYKVKFANASPPPITNAQGKFLRSLILKGLTATECQKSLLKKFKRTISNKTLWSFAKRNGIKWTGKYIYPDQYTNDEISTINGLVLIGASEKRMVADLPTRSLNSTMRKIRRAKISGATSDAIKESVKQDLMKGVSEDKVAKKTKLVPNTSKNLKRT